MHRLSGLPFPSPLHRSLLHKRRANPGHSACPHRDLLPMPTKQPISGSCSAFLSSLRSRIHPPLHSTAPPTPDADYIASAAYPEGILRRAWTRAIKTNVRLESSSRSTQIPYENRYPSDDRCLRAIRTQLDFLVRGNFVLLALMPDPSCASQSSSISSARRNSGVRPVYAHSSPPNGTSTDTRALMGLFPFALDFRPSSTLSPSTLPRLFPRARPCSVLLSSFIASLTPSFLSTDDPVVSLGPSLHQPFRRPSILSPCSPRTPTVLSLRRRLHLLGAYAMTPSLLFCAPHAPLFHPPTPNSAFLFASVFLPLLFVLHPPACTTLIPSLQTRCTGHPPFGRTGPPSSLTPPLPATNRDTHKVQTRQSEDYDPQSVVKPDYIIGPFPAAPRRILQWTWAVVSWQRPRINVAIGCRLVFHPYTNLVRRRISTTRRALPARGAGSSSAGADFETAEREVSLLPALHWVCIYLFILHFVHPDISPL
ncbi:hypothetical protein K438DRAFT_1996356 [Mycena galopus ATCC 62051]|nr:hypothetical protein K438DRAFT_1996356 [Mycena galopus ATCC 62051]